MEISRISSIFHELGGICCWICYTPWQRHTTSHFTCLKIAFISSEWFHYTKRANELPHIRSLHILSNENEKLFRLRRLLIEIIRLSNKKFPSTFNLERIEFEPKRRRECERDPSNMREMCDILCALFSYNNLRIFHLNSFNTRAL